MIEQWLASLRSELWYLRHPSTSIASLQHKLQQGAVSEMQSAPGRHSVPSPQQVIMGGGGGAGVTASGAGVGNGNGVEVVLGAGVGVEVTTVTTTSLLLLLLFFFPLIFPFLPLFSFP